VLGDGWRVVGQGVRGRRGERVRRGEGAVAKGTQPKVHDRLLRLRNAPIVGGSGCARSGTATALMAHRHLAGPLPIV